MTLNLGSLDIMIIYIDDMPRKYIPIDIYDSEISYEPDIIVPIEYLVEEVEIEQYRIHLKIKKRYEILDEERIVVIEKGRQCQSEKQCHDDTIHYQERVSVTDENKLLMLSEVFAEENLIKIIHKR